MRYLILLLVLLTGCNLDYQVKCKANQVTIDMSEIELEKTCGKPYARNYSSPYGDTQWIYRGDESLYVYTKDGKVRSKQWSD